MSTGRPTREPRDRPPLRARLRRVALKLGLVVLFLEVALRAATWFAYGRDPYYLLYGFQGAVSQVNVSPWSVFTGRHYKYPPNYALRGAAGQAGETAHTNALGFRGPDFEPVKPPGTLRVFCMGGSSTFGFHNDDDETYPRLPAGDPGGRRGDRARRGDQRGLPLLPLRHDPRLARAGAGRLRARRGHDLQRLQRHGLAARDRAVAGRGALAAGALDHLPRAAAHDPDRQEHLSLARAAGCRRLPRPGRARGRDRAFRGALPGQPRGARGPGAAHGLRAAPDPPADDDRDDQPVVRGPDVRGGVPGRPGQARGRRVALALRPLPAAPPPPDRGARPPGRARGAGGDRQHPAAR